VGARAVSVLVVSAPLFFALIGLVLCFVLRFALILALRLALFLPRALHAQMKKARRIRQAFVNLVAGAGFEPTTFGL
jgi:hypothetical protein